jgi:hypothetical protein
MIVYCMTSGDEMTSEQCKAVRKLSFISGQVPLRLKGIAYTICMKGGTAKICKLTNVKINHLEAYRVISQHHRQLRGPAADEEDTPLSVCLEGFRRYFNDNFAVILPLEVESQVPDTIYHESCLCDLTRICSEPGCRNAVVDGGDAGSLTSSVTPDVATLHI